MVKESAWSKGVSIYAAELRETLAENNLPATKENMLNGARNWSEYSYGGSALTYDADIAERLCSPSELKRKKGGDLQPNSRETWLDCQARPVASGEDRVAGGKIMLRLNIRIDTINAAFDSAPGSVAHGATDQHDN